MQTVSASYVRSVLPERHATGMDHSAGVATVTIAVLTFNRPASLRRAIESVNCVAEVPQGTKLSEILVIDNHPSANAAVALSDINTRYPLRVVHEPSTGVSHARNRALTEATTDYLVFLDDDEIAVRHWPGGLIDELRSRFGMAGGPVEAVFEPDPPPWVADGGFFDRANPETGTPQTWLRSGNLAIDLRIVEKHSLRFSECFNETGSEDVEFTMRARSLGIELGWCHVASVAEVIGSDRTNETWIVARASSSLNGYLRAYRAVFGRRRHVVAVLRAVSLRLVIGTWNSLLGWATRSHATRVRGKASLRSSLAAAATLRSR